MSQLFNLTAKIANLLPSLKIEKIQHEENAPWAKNLNLLINIHISELDKCYGLTTTTEVTCIS